MHQDWRIFACAALALCCLVSETYAATMEWPPRARNWSGGWFSGNVGYGSGTFDNKANPIANSGSFTEFRGTSYDIKPTGGFGGVEIGYDYQYGDWILGGMADFNWTRIHEKTSIAPVLQANGSPAPGSSLTAEQEFAFISTIRGRAGYLLRENLLLYVTGGYGVAQIKLDATTTLPSNSFTAYRITEHKPGWVFGFGSEYVLNRSWSVKGEYLYYTFMETEYDAMPDPGNTTNRILYRSEPSISLFRGGIIYKFN